MVAIDSSANPPDEGPQVVPFSVYLVATDGGRTHAELTSQLHELVEAVLRTGKAGQLQLLVKVSPEDVENRRLSIVETVTSKLPQRAAKKSVFWADDDNNLVRNDPSQLQFGDLRSADRPATLSTQKQAN
jgi:hypothetical protein